MSRCVTLVKFSNRDINLPALSEALMNCVTKQLGKQMLAETFVNTRTAEPSSSALPSTTASVKGQIRPRLI